MNNGVYKQWDTVLIKATVVCGTVMEEQAALNIQEYKLQVKVEACVVRETGEQIDASSNWYRLCELENPLLSRTPEKKADPMPRRLRVAIALLEASESVIDWVRERTRGSSDSARHLVR